MTADSADTAAPAKPRGNSLLWLGGVGLGVVVTVTTSTALVLGVLLAPVVMATLCDPRPRRHAARPMLLFGLAATLHPVFVLWRDGQSFEVAIALITNPRVVALAWAAEAAGWLLGELLPFLVLIVLEAHSRARAAKLRAARARHEAEWEIPPRSNA